jgi:acetyl-CoA synthetase
VADRNRRVPLQHPAGHHPHETGQRRTGHAGHSPHHLDDEGKEVPRGAGKAGNICIQNPWPGMFQTIWGDRDRFVDTYFARYCKDPKSTDWRDWPYLTGDAAVEAEDGYYRILGRIDDVINVSGHRLGTKEIESAALVVPEEVAEAAVVPVNHEIKGKEPDLYIALKPGSRPATNWPRKSPMPSAPRSAKIAKPRKVWIVPTCPRPVPARSCAGCWAPCPTARMWATS